MRSLELVVLRGPTQSGKSTVARELATHLGGKAAVIHIEDLLSRWILVHDADRAAEEQMVYRQVRLLASGYLRAGYHLIVEGSFATWTGSEVRSQEDELAAFRSLMSTIPGIRLSVFALTAPLEELRRRAGVAAGLRGDAIDALFAAYAAFEPADTTAIDTAHVSVDVVTDRILLALGLVAG